jgi:hypothetical protein
VHVDAQRIETEPLEDRAFRLEPQARLRDRRQAVRPPDRRKDRERGRVRHLAGVAVHDDAGARRRERRRLGQDPRLLQLRELHGDEQEEHHRG